MLELTSLFAATPKQRRANGRSLKYTLSKSHFLSINMAVAILPDKEKYTL